MDAVPIDRPIFVLGLQGGGTTLVARCLLRHPAVVSVSGNSQYWVATDEMGFVRNRMARLPPSLWSSSHRADLDAPGFGTTHNSVYACDALLPFYRQTAADATREDAKRLTRLIREHIAVYARDPSSARGAIRRKPPAWRVVPPYDEQLRLAAERTTGVRRSPSGTRLSSTSAAASSRESWAINSRATRRRGTRCCSAAPLPPAGSGAAMTERVRAAKG